MACGNLLNLKTCVLVLGILYQQSHAVDPEDPNPSPGPGPGPSPNNHKNEVTELVDTVCGRTSNYTFCVEALYTDPRTPKAGRYTLAYISFGLGHSNARAARDDVTNLLKDPSRHRPELQSLQRCEKDYNESVSKFGLALNDLNSETFFTLPDLANEAAHAADDCGAQYPPLAPKSNYLKALCEICVSAAKLFLRSEFN